MEPRDAINSYTCEKCGHTFYTINDVEGVTPFMTKCRFANIGCADNALAQSNFYRISPENIVGPKWEWYKPVGEEYNKLDPIDKKNHVDRGGLLLRKLDAVRLSTRYGYDVRQG